MNFEDRCERLKRIYDIYDGFAAAFERACRKHCATCCTCNVTATTLEGWLILDRLRSVAADCGSYIETLAKRASSRRFHPKMTINEMVALCMQDKSLPDEYNDPAAGNCPLVEDGACPVYTVRPFGCRAMLSTVDCSGRGQAHMPPLILSANNVVMQSVEALDRPGASGNLIDILLFLSDPQQRRSYEIGQCREWPPPLQSNQSVPVLMIPPEHRKALQPLLEALSMCSI